MSEDRRPSDDSDPTRLESGQLDSRTEEATRQGEPARDETVPGNKRLGDFELGRELGRGGMGVVYEARQVSLNRRVALKVLPPGLGLTETAVRRFEREARAAARLHHTNIVPVHAIGEESGCHFYAMELIEGEPLSRVLNDMRGQGSNPLMEAAVTHTATASSTKEHEEAASPATSGPSSLSDTSSSSREWFDTVARLLADVADALHYAHGRGVIHRDVKPANLMLSEDGRLCVTDFGLARVAQEPGMTVSGSFLGTPAYMSPEQIAAGRVEIDARTDVYSLGAVLYEMLTLQRPFGGESRDAILQAIMTKDPRPPRRYNPRVPVDLETICQKAMEKDRDRRYRSAGELANDLRQYLQRGLITARRASLSRRAWKSVRRQPVAAASVVGLIAVIAVGAFALRQTAGRSEEAAQRLVAAAEVDLREGTYRQGLKKIERALVIDPELPAANRTRGRLLFESNSSPRELVRIAREFLTENPEDWEAHGWMVFAGASLDLGDIPVDEHLAALERSAPDTAEAWYVRGIGARTGAERIRCFDRVLELNPGYVMALAWRAQTKRTLHDSAGAIADANAAIAARPRSTRGRRFLASTYLWDLRDIERARVEFDRAVEIDPEDCWVYKERSWIYRQGNLDDREKRVKELDRALELAPDEYRLLVARNSALRAMSRNEEALADALRAVEIEPHDVDSWSSLITSLGRLERHEEAREAMEELRRLAEGWPNRRAAAAARATLSYFHRHLGELEEAVAAAEQAIELDPINVGNHSTLVSALRAKEEEAGVAEACDRVEAFELSEPESLNARATLMRFGCERPDAALEDFARAIELAPQWAALYYERCKFHLNRAELDAAITDCELAIERAPLWPDLHRMRGLALKNQKRYAEALASNDRAIELAPRNATALYNRALVYMKLEQFERALDDLERTFDALGGPRVPGMNVRWNQVIALARLGREEEALAAADLAIANYPENNLPIRQRVEVSLVLGRTGEAQEYAERAVEHSPESAWPYIYRARGTLIGDGDHESAIADLETAHRLAPDDPAIASGLADAYVVLVFLRRPDRFDAELALELATQAATDQPENSGRQVVLGLTMYRLSRLREAKEHLKKGTDLHAPTIGTASRFGLAMTEWKLGNQTAAREHYDRAVSRMNETWPRFPEYILMRDEAAALLGIEP